MGKEPLKLKTGDEIAIVSLSSGVLGEPFCAHQLKLGVKRLAEFGLKPKFMTNSLKGMEFIKNHPQKRAEDLKAAFADQKIKAIICAIGGNDTYLTVKYLLEDENFVSLVKKNPKIFLGYSDSTINHLTLNKVGLSTFYGFSFLTDLAELDQEMLPETKTAWLNLFQKNGSYEVKSSHFWYEERKDFSIDELNRPRIKHLEKIGHQFYGSKDVIQGKLFGGCLETIFEDLMRQKNNEENVLFKYSLLPSEKEWADKIFFLETSEEKVKPEQFKKEMFALDDLGIFKTCQAVIFGKPQDNVFYEEYKKIAWEILKKYQKPVVFNLNFGHAYPKIILPYNAEMTIDFKNQKITITE